MRGDRWTGESHDTGLTFPSPHNVNIKFIVLEQNFCKVPDLQVRRWGDKDDGSEDKEDMIDKPTYCTYIRQTFNGQIRKQLEEEGKLMYVMGGSVNGWTNTGED